MNRRVERTGQKWLLLFCSFVLLLAGWFVKPETAREWLERARGQATAAYQNWRGQPGRRTQPGSSVGESEATSMAANGGLPIEARKLTLYLPSRTNPGMLDAVEAPTGSASTPKELAMEAVNLLQAPPPQTAHPAALPAGTRLLALFVEGNRMIVDLSPEFLSKPPESAAEARLALYALINTLTSLPIAEEVRLLVNDEERTSYFELFDLTSYYRFNSEVVAQRGAVDRAR